MKPKYSYLGLPAPRRAHAVPNGQREDRNCGGSSARHTTRDPPPRPREPCSPFSPRASMPKAQIGRPCKQDGSPATRARREKARIKKREQLQRAALGQNRPTGRPPKQQMISCRQPDQVAAEATDLDQNSSSRLNSTAPAPQRPAHKPLAPDGNPASPHPPANIAVPALLTVTAQVFETGVADEELCLICTKGKHGIAGVLPSYLPCCAGRIHDNCLASWRRSSQRNGQKFANAHNCPHCKTHLAGTRDLRRDAPPTDAEMRKFKLDRGGERYRRLQFDEA